MQSGQGSENCDWERFEEVRLRDSKDDGLWIIWYSFMRQVPNVEEVPEGRPTRAAGSRSSRERCALQVLLTNSRVVHTSGT